MKRVVVNPKFRHLGDFVASVEQRFPHEGKTIYKSRNEIKVLQYERLELNVKQYAVPHLVNRFVYAVFRKPKAVRAYEYALRLLDLGVPTPEPIGYVLFTDIFGLGSSYLITPQSPFRRNMYEFDEGGVVGREDIIASFAHFTADLHRKGIYHRDYSPGNILFDQVDGEWCFTLVDINRMRFGKVSLRDGCRNFARLWGKRDFFQLLAHHYAEAMNAPEEEVFQLIDHYRERFWRKYNQ